jgi:hypothetical protein
MPTDPLEHAVFLVTGSNLVAEQKDRPLAYFLKAQVDRYGGDDPGRRGIVVGDLWYEANEVMHNYPTIAVGGPAVNAVSRRYWHRLPVALAVDNVFVIQADVTGGDLRASVWGMDHETTREAVQTFYEKGHLRKFLESAWNQPLDELEKKPPPADDTLT